MLVYRGVILSVSALAKFLLQLLRDGAGSYRPRAHIWHLPWLQTGFGLAVAVAKLNG